MDIDHEENKILNVDNEENEMINNDNERNEVVNNDDKESEIGIRPEHAQPFCQVRASVENGDRDVIVWLG